jgi:hypothetical protein
MNIKPIVLCACSAGTAVLGGCAAYESYDGQRPTADDVAVIQGDAKIGAGAPLAVVIRAVDGKEVGVGYSSVKVLPGRHTLLVDCRINPPKGITSRHTLEINAGAGERYRLRAEMRPGNRGCERVVAE